MEKIKIDESEIAERAFLLELISTVLQLSYTSRCDDKVLKLVDSSCEGCKLKLRGRENHHCRMTEENEAYLLYYNKAKQLVDPNRVWDSATQVSQMLVFNIHPSWRAYISDLYKLPWATVFGFSLQIEYAHSRAQQIFLKIKLKLKLN